jgi:NAD(P)-dependent dehydrogenase (short-subunit alcohol dehydrogenase family)
MGKTRVSTRHNQDRRDFLSGMGGIAAVAATTPSLAEITQVGAGQNLPETTTAPTSLPNGRLQDKVAAVTGAARGIGRAVIVAFAREGADIIGLDICAAVDPRSGVEPSTQEDLDETGRLVRTAGRRWLGIKVDQRDLPALRAAGVRAERKFGGIDILFANAGIQSFHPLLEMEDPDCHITIDVNLTGTANAVRAFAPYLVKRGGGRIILTSSTQGQHGTKFGAPYAESKWGIIDLMKSAALELGQFNITVNALIPGLINTPLTRHKERYAQVLETAGQSPTGLSPAEEEEDARKILITRAPLGVPWIEPEDIAPVVVFLASDAARMASGATYDVSGGGSANNTT